MWATDDGISRRRRRRDDDNNDDDGPPPLVTLTWHLHQGPGEVVFGDDELEIREDGDGRAETTVTFTEPGEYLLRVLANDRSGGGGSQCCWTNAFVKVRVSE